MPYYPPTSTGYTPPLLQNFQAANNNSTVQYWLIATLPASGGATFDSLTISATMNDNWASATNNTLIVTVGNRGGFNYDSETLGYVNSNAGIRCYTEAGGTVSVYAYLKASTFSSINLSMLAAETTNSLGGSPVTIYLTPTLTTSPTGSLSYDSTDATNYPPRICLGSNSTSQTSAGTTVTVATNTTPIAVLDATSNSHADYVSRRSGSETATLFQGANLYLSNSTSGSSAGIQNYAGNMQFFSSTAGSNTEKMRLDSSGNLGLGVTPQAWATPAIEISGSASVVGRTLLTFGVNNYYDGNNRYIANGYASQTYMTAAGQIFWQTAPSGTAGNVITFTQAMTLFNNGNFAVGYTTDQGYKLQVNGTALHAGNTVLGTTTLDSWLAGSSTNAVIQFPGHSGFQGINGQLNTYASAYNDGTNIRYGSTGSNASLLSVAANAMQFSATTSTGTAGNVATLTTGFTASAAGVAVGNGTLAANYKFNVIGGPSKMAGTSNPIRTVTGTTDTVASTDSTIIHNTTSTTTETLPSAGTYTGLTLYFMNQVAGAVNSASSNVIPAGSSSAGTAILAATAGKWAMLQSDGTNWRIIMNN